MLNLENVVKMVGKITSRTCKYQKNYSRNLIPRSTNKFDSRFN